MANSENSATTIAELWTLLEQQQVQLAAQAAEMATLKAELHTRQEQSVTPSPLREEDTGHTNHEQRISRAGLLKLGAVSAVGVAGAALMGMRNIPNVMGATNFVAFGGNDATVGFDATLQSANFVTGVAGYGSRDGVSGKSSTGTGVNGHSNSGTGVAGTTGSSSSGIGVAGSASGAGSGVYGQAGPGGVGIFGSCDGTGVYGQSDANMGVHGASNSGKGIRGDSNTGYGGSFGGGKAPLHLDPASNVGHPTNGAYLKGDLFVDANGTLWICVASGSPGTWKEIAVQ